MNRKPFSLTHGAVALLLAATATAALAESPEAAEIRALRQQLEQSMSMIKELANKVNRLEQASAPAAAPAASGTQQARLDDLQEQVRQLGSGISRRGDDGIPVHGFADVGYVSSNSDQTNIAGRRGAKGFGVGSFDLYLTPSFGDRVKSLVELVFEVDANGDVVTDLERVQAGYTFSDALTAWVGRFHTPYGYWNTGFHHGAQIQTSISRPRFLDFEDKGGILPAHLTGAWLTGGVGTGLGKLNYDLYAANAPRIQVDVAGGATKGTLNMRMAGNDGNRNLVGFNVGFSPRALPGLQAGLHGLRGNIGDNLAGNRTRVSMFGGYGVYTENDWELLAEYYGFRNSDLSGATGRHSSKAWYAQAGNTIGRYTPFFRLEQTQLDQADNYFLVQDSGRSYKRSALGLRYELDPKAALKVEFMHTDVPDLVPGVRDRFGEWRLQYAVRF